MGQTFTARQTAQAINAALAKRGVKLARPVDAKRVRAWVRDNVDAYDDDDYTAHQYDARTQDRIVTALTSRYAPNAKGTAGRASAASSGRNAKRPAMPERERKARAKDAGVPAPESPDV